MNFDTRIKPEVATAVEDFVQRYLYDSPFTHLAQSILTREPGWTEEDARQFRRLVVRELLMREQSRIRSGSAAPALNAEQSGTATPKQASPKTFHTAPKPPFLPVMPGATVVTKSR